MFDIRGVDLDRLNSLTKYLSIPTYHRLGDKGRITEELATPFPSGSPMFGTEKIDGTNGRILFTPDGSAIIGSREELLWASGDLIGNPSMGLVAFLRPVVHRLLAERLADRVAKTLGFKDPAVVLFGELYGKGIGPAKQYTSGGIVGFRLFDVMVQNGVDDLLSKEREQISRWRDAGGQHYLKASDMLAVAVMAELETVPALFQADGGELPSTVDGVVAWMQQFKTTQAALDDGAGRQCEGIVVRTEDRRVIAKLRFEDYARRPIKQAAQ